MILVPGTRWIDTSHGAVDAIERHPTARLPALRDRDDTSRQRLVTTWRMALLTSCDRELSSGECGGWELQRQEAGTGSHVWLGPWRSSTYLRRPRSFLPHQSGSPLMHRMSQDVAKPTGCPVHYASPDENPRAAWRSGMVTLLLLPDRPPPARFWRRLPSPSHRGQWELFTWSLCALSDAQMHDNDHNTFGRCLRRLTSRNPLAFTHERRSSGAEVSRPHLLLFRREGESREGRC